MARNTRWPAERARGPSDSGTTIIAILAVLVVLGIIYVAVQGFGTATEHPLPLPASPLPTSPMTMVPPNTPAPTPPAAVPDTP